MSNNITPKQFRIITRALQHLQSEQAYYAPKTGKDFPRQMEFFLRKLDVGGRRTIFLTDSGKEALFKIVDTLEQADIFPGQVGRGDILNVLRDRLQHFLKNGFSFNTQKFIDSFQQELKAVIRSWTFAVPLYGVRLYEAGTLQLRSMQMVSSPEGVIKDQQLATGDEARIKELIERHGLKPWLIGTTIGTRRIAEIKFRSRALLLVGSIAVAGAAMYKGGASSIRIGIVMTPADMEGPIEWFSWNEVDRSLCTHRAWSSKQPLDIDGDLRDFLVAEGPFRRALEIFESERRSVLEEAIVRGMFWYSEAQRDMVPAMQLIKFWSCVETFFSESKEDVSEQVAGGLASVIVFGGHGFVPREHYGDLRRDIKKLYNQRSRALHGGKYEHVTEREVGELSQWCAWMLITILGLLDCGYETTAQVREQAFRLDGAEAEKT